MGKWSGKCDCSDSFMDESDEYIANSKFYIHTKDGRDHKLDIKSWKDLAPYATHLIASMGRDTEKACVFLASTSFIDEEEEKRLTFVLDTFKKYWRKCKREKKEYIVDDALKLRNFFGEPAEYEILLALKVKQDGEKATIKGIHDSLHEYYRKEFYDYLISLGYEESWARIWIYGWERVYEDKKRENVEQNTEAT